LKRCIEIFEQHESEEGRTGGGGGGGGERIFVIATSDTGATLQ